MGIGSSRFSEMIERESVSLPDAKMAVIDLMASYYADLNFYNKLFDDKKEFDTALKVAFYRVGRKQNVLESLGIKPEDIEKFSKDSRIKILVDAIRRLRPIQKSVLDMKDINELDTILFDFYKLARESLKGLLAGTLEFRLAANITDIKRGKEAFAFGVEDAALRAGADPLVIGNAVSVLADLANCRYNPKDAEIIKFEPREASN